MITFLLETNNNNNYWQWTEPQTHTITEVEV